MKCKNNLGYGEGGYSLTEIMIVIAILSIIAVSATIALFQFRNSVQYNILLNRITESVNYTKLRSLQSELDDNNARISYSVIFFEDRIVEFEGTIYDEDAETNVEFYVPFGLSLSSVCSPVNNGVVTFTPVEAKTLNRCTISIHRFEQPGVIGNVVIGTYGVEDAS